MRVDRRGIEPLTDWLPAILAPMEHVGPHNETKTRIVKETTLRDSNPHLSRSVVRLIQSVFPLHQAPMFSCKWRRCIPTRILHFLSVSCTDTQWSRRESNPPSLLAKQSRPLGTCDPVFVWSAARSRRFLCFNRGQTSNLFYSSKRRFVKENQTKRY